MAGNFTTLDFGDNSTNANISTIQNITTPETYTSLPYYGHELKTFRFEYSKVHGYLSLFVCIFGVITNTLNIIVLTRKNIISSTNIILTGLAVADMCIMSTYAPYVIHDYILRYEPESKTTSYSWAMFTLFRNDFNPLCHSISAWMTVTLAIWRFLALAFPLHNRMWLSMEKAKIAVFCNYFFGTISCIPIYLTYGLVKVGTGSPTVYGISYSSLASNNLLMGTITFWFYSVVTKLIPCILLTILSVLLVIILYRADKRKQKLKNIESDKDYERATRIIIAVVMIFLITMFPNGILALITAILGFDFYANFYLHLREIIDLLALINSSVNFILYCSMSRQFRETFAVLFIPKFVSNLSTSNTSITTKL